MADNITLPGTGSVMATDDIAAVHYQIVKLACGALDTATLLALGQATMAASLPVTIASNQSPVLTYRTGWSVGQTLTVTNDVYTVGDVVGGLITLTGAAAANGHHTMIRQVTLAGVVANVYNLFFLSADIATPAADNAAFTTIAADGLLFRGSVSIAAADYCKTAGAFYMASVVPDGGGLVCQVGAATTSLYAYLVATAVTSPGTTTMYIRVTGEHLDY